MTVYIEYVFASNFVFDFVLLFSVEKIARLKTSKKRLFFATLFGTLVAVVLPIANFGVVLSLFFKLCLSCGIVFVLGGFKTKKQFFSILILFWALTFGIGGVLVGIYFLTNTNFALQQDLSVVSNNPLPLFVGGLLLFAFFVKNLFGFINDKKTKINFEYDVTIVVGNDEVVVKGFLDSGNRLCDVQTGLPVVIVTSQKLKKFFANKLSCIANKTSLLKNVRYTKFATLSGGVQKMLVFDVDKVIIGGCERQVAIGIANKQIGFGYDLLLNGNMQL